MTSSVKPSNIPTLPPIHRLVSVKKKIKNNGEKNIDFLPKSFIFGRRNNFSLYISF